MIKSEILGKSGIFQTFRIIVPPYNEVCQTFARATTNICQGSYRKASQNEREAITKMIYSKHPKLYFDGRWRYICIYIHIHNASLQQRISQKTRGYAQMVSVHSPREIWIELLMLSNTRRRAVIGKR